MMVYDVDVIYFKQRTYNLSLDFFCGNNNLPPDKMFGKSKVLPDKTEF